MGPSYPANDGNAGSAAVCWGSRIADQGSQVAVSDVLGNHSRVGEGHGAVPGAVSSVLSCPGTNDSNAGSAAVELIRVSK